MRRYIVAFLAASTFNVTSLAQAADLPRAQPAYKAAPVPPAPNWGGFYLGLQGGYGWGQSSGTQSAGGTFFPVVPYTIDPRGFIGGGHAGYNVQRGKAVFGIEGDIEAAHIDGLSEVLGYGAPRYFNVTADTLASIRGRVGWSHERWLIYATGGIAFGHVETPPLDSLTGWRTGWTLGAGIERKTARLGPNWSTRFEYRYTDLGRVSSDDPALGTTDDNKLAFHALRVGLTYRFNP